MKDSTPVERAQDQFNRIEEALAKISVFDESDHAMLADLDKMLEHHELFEGWE